MSYYTSAYPASSLGTSMFAPSFDSYAAVPTFGSTFGLSSYAPATPTFATAPSSYYPSTSTFSSPFGYPTTFGTAPTWSFGGMPTYTHLKLATPAAAEEEKVTEPIKITYFGVKAKALFPMLVAEVGGVPYTWEKVEMADWPAMKASTPFGQLPIMSHGEVSIAQSNAIAMYIGKKAGLLGNTDVDFATSMMLVSEYEDMFNALAKAYYGANKEADVDTMLSVYVPAELTKLEALLSGAFTNERTIGELAIFAMLNIYKDLKEDVLENFPALTAFYNHLAKDPKVAELLPKAGALWYQKDW